MEIDNELAQKLLTMPKLITVGEEVKEKYEVRFPNAQISERHYMCSLDKKWRFLVDIKQKKFKKASISFHFQERDNAIQLFRVDYNASGHKNPQVASEYVPSYLLPYVGKEISSNHAHIFVPKENPLLWAIPLEDYDFQQKKLSNVNELCYATEEFLKRINLQTDFTIERRLFL